MTEIKLGKDNVQKPVKHTFHGRNIRGYIHSDRYWLYTLSDSAEYYDNKLHKMKRDKQEAMRKENDDEDTGVP